MTKQEKAFGLWESPITPDMITAGTKGFGDIVLDGDQIYWSELRPDEKGRSVIVHYAPNNQSTDAIGGDFNARSRCHEYGGAAFTVRDGVIYFSNNSDQKVYVKNAKGTRALTGEGMRFADLHVTRDGLIAICEDHRSGGEAKNSLVLIDVETGAIRTLAEGHDFYASPALDANESRITWITWKHPNMPWDATQLWVADITDGELTNVQAVAGGDNESVFEPQWAPNGDLYFVSDPNGWWNFFRWNGESTELVYEAEAEFGFPQWVFGMSTWGFVGDKIFCTFAVECQWKLGLLDPATHNLEVLDVEGTDFAGIRTGNGFAVFHQGSPTRSNRIVKLDLASRKLTVIAENSEPAVNSDYFSIAEQLSFPSAGGRTAHAFYYAPKNPNFAAPAGSKPPLLVLSHGGPTSNTRCTLKLATQYWTSRGIAVLDVNYGGSTGYGRKYRDLLKGTWGVVDREDCEAGARYLAGQGLVDPKKLAIRGGSAGGFTTLSCLTFGDVFTVGASYYGVSDCEALAKDTHKFESRYLDSMIGPYPECRDLYVARSPVKHTDQISCPLIFFQGDEDKVVPPSQSERMYEALQKKGLKSAYHLFEGEQHGFRNAENIQTAMTKELEFYLEVFDAQS